MPYFPALWTHTALWEHKLSLFQFQRNLVQLNDYRHVSLTYIVMKYLKKKTKTKKELCLYSRKRSILYWLYSNLPTGKGGAHDAANSAICLTIRHLEKPKTFCMSPFRWLQLSHLLISKLKQINIILCYKEACFRFDQLNLVCLGDQYPFQNQDQSASYRLRFVSALHLLSLYSVFLHF